MRGVVRALGLRTRAVGQAGIRRQLRGGLVVREPLGAYLRLLLVVAGELPEAERDENRGQHEHR